MPLTGNTMMRTPYTRIFFILWVGIAVGMGNLCAYGQDPPAPSGAIMPFVKGKDPEKIEQTLNCPYADICFENENILDIDNHELIWTATYDETQQSLTENLLNALDFFKQGARWLTADEFARYGMQKILKRFPDIPNP